jgi:DAACS family dicarboxylate/amino acid:cation (Na+ or H+) symporter
MTDAREIADEAAPIGHGKLQWRILMGFVLGLGAGLLVYTFARDAEWVATVVTYVTGPIGQIFLRLLFMLVIPLLFSALVVGIAEMGEVRALKKIGIRTLLYTVIVSGIAVALSITLVNLLQPGAGVDRAAANELLAQGAEGARGIVERSGEAATGVDAVIGQEGPFTGQPQLDRYRQPGVLSIYIQRAPAEPSQISSPLQVIEFRP